MDDYKNFLEQENIYLKERLEKQKRLTRYHRTQNDMYLGIFCYCMMFVWIILFVGYGFERLDYNYDGFFNTHYFKIFLLSFVFPLIPLVIRLYANITYNMENGVTVRIRKANKASSKSDKTTKKSNSKKCTNVKVAKRNNRVNNNVIDYRKKK